MVFTVHAQLGRTAAACDNHGPVGAGFHQGRRLDDRVHRRCAEASHIRASSVHKSRHLCCRLGEVTPASLVHVPAGLLRAVDDVLHVLLPDARVADSVEKCQDAGRLAHQVLVHHMGGQVLVDIVGSLHAAYQLAVKIESLRVLLVYKLLDLGELHALVHSFKDFLRDHRILGKGLPVGCHKPFLQPYHLEHVAGLHKKEELLLRHDLTEFAVALCPLHLLVVPGEFHLRQLLRMDVADVGLVGPVGYRLLVRAEPVRHLLQILRLGIDDALCRLCCSVIQNHIRRMY